MKRRPMFWISLGPRSWSKSLAKSRPDQNETTFIVLHCCSSFDVSLLPWVVYCCSWCWHGRKSAGNAAQGHGRVLQRRRRGGGLRGDWFSGRNSYVLQNLSPNFCWVLTRNSEDYLLIFAALFWGKCWLMSRVTWIGWAAKSTGGTAGSRRKLDCPDLSCALAVSGICQGSQFKHEFRPKPRTSLPKKHKCCSLRRWGVAWCLWRGKWWVLSWSSSGRNCTETLPRIRALSKKRWVSWNFRLCLFGIFAATDFDVMGFDCFGSK